MLLPTLLRQSREVGKVHGTSERVVWNGKTGDRRAVENLPPYFIFLTQLLTFSTHILDEIPVGYVIRTTANNAMMILVMQNSMFSQNESDVPYKMLDTKAHFKCEKAEPPRCGPQQGHC